MSKGIIISGKFGEIVLRQKHGAELEIGELLIGESNDRSFLLQVYDLLYGSQLSSSNLELISGMKLEEDTDMFLMDKNIRYYKLAMLKNLITIGRTAKSSKSLPDFFSEVREVRSEDLKFLSRPKNPLFIGHLRSGSKKLDVDVFLQGDKVFSHHILIPATTGRGKSNLASVMLWDSIDKEYCGILVLDPHDEYYGRNRKGLKDHPSKNLVYYTPNDPPPGARTLKINLKQIKPNHFNGVVDWSGPQREALISYYRSYRDDWIKAILTERDLPGYMEGTLAVIKRRILSLLNLEYSDRIVCNGIFDDERGEATINDICTALEQSKTVIIDTSSFSGSVEILVGSLITSQVFSRYKRYKTKGLLKNKPVISVLLEEAPRVLGKEVLEKGANIFSTIAREGRKFKIGLTAITQLPSLIPRQILANMNTKIILGIEMAPERQAIIDSASQDLSSDSRAIASLDKGEAIITSNFSKFALPVKIPLFSEYIEKNIKKEDRLSYEGISLS